ncbi:hypothetical protein TWF481_003163 [Arthrobotrys musiformis]|uniref:Uncharacterized protein n=1 Tax=Arthrobotrys musiformis TaxID=47236 RepID=A0AAV9VPH4_9PEZI
MFNIPRNIKENLHDDVTKIYVSGLAAPTDIPDRTPIIEGTATVSSYNWLAEHEVESYVPTIQVPGAPPLLNFPETSPPMQLLKDAGHHFVDQNAARMAGKSGLIPGLAACYAYKKDFNITDYDVVTDRNNLIKLFELIELSVKSGGDEDFKPPTTTPWRAPSIDAAVARRGRGRGGNGIHPFFQKLGPGHGRGIKSMDRRAETTRIDVDVVSGYDNQAGKYIYDEAAPKKTLVMTRWEPVNEEVVVASEDFRGFGHSFLTKTREFLLFDEGRVVERGPKDVTGFHCLVEYKLLGMKMLVRYHADTCDMTREEFVKWISKDALRDLSEEEDQKEPELDYDSEDAGSDGTGSEDRTLYESPATDTFDLLDAFKTLTVNDPKSTTVPGLKKPSAQNKNTDTVAYPQIPLDVIQTPNTVFPGEKILQVKTRGKHTGLNREKLYVQLFFSQTQNVFVAYHSRGLFSGTETVKEDIKVELVKWAVENKTLLKKLILILREVKDTVEEMGGKGALGFLLKKKASEDPVILDVQGRAD